jgi:hypothetical protein
MMNKSLLAYSAKSSRKSFYGFQQVRLLKSRCTKSTPAKKEPPFPAAFEVDNREASNRVDRSHSVSKQGRPES